MAWTHVLGFLFAAYVAGSGLWAFDSVKGVAAWSYRNRWRCWAWWLGLFWLCGVLTATAYLFPWVPGTGSSARLISGLAFSWPLGAVVGGVIDGLLRLRSRRATLRLR